MPPPNETRLTAQEKTVASAQLITEETKLKLKRFWADNGKHIMSVVAGRDTKAHEAALYSCLYRTPGLINCTPFSLLNSLVLANQLGLRVGTQECAIAPFGTEAQLLIQYQGKVKLALGSKLIKSVEADVVYEFEYEKDFRWARTAAGLDFYHKPDFRRRALADSVAKPENVIGAYCQMGTEGGMQTRFVDLGEILDARAKSRSYKKNPETSFWTTDFAAACLKTAVHRASKLAPQDSKMGRANEVDDEDMGGPAVIAEGLDPSQFPVDDTQRPLVESGTEQAQEVASRKSGRSTKPASVKTEPAAIEPTLNPDQCDSLGDVWQEGDHRETLAQFLQHHGVASGLSKDVPVSRLAELMTKMRVGDAAE